MNRTFLGVLVVSFVVVACAKNNAPTPASSGQSAPTKAAHAPAKGKSATPATEASKAPTVESKGGIMVSEAVACTSVENRSPVGVAEKFAPNVGRLYLFTKLTVAGSAESSVKHIWKHNGKEMTTVTLPVRGPNWRTYSSKQIDPSQTGAWSVEIMQGTDLLKTVAFKVE